MPNDPVLPTLRAELTTARANAGAALEAQLKRAQELMREGRVTGDGDDNALAQYKAVLARDPTNTKARRGAQPDRTSAGRAGQCSARG